MPRIIGSAAMLGTRGPRYTSLTWPAGSVVSARFRLSFGSARVRWRYGRFPGSFVIDSLNIGFRSRQVAPFFVVIFSWFVMGRFNYARS